MQFRNDFRFSITRRRSDGLGGDEAKVGQGNDLVGRHSDLASVSTLP